MFSTFIEEMPAAHTVFLEQKSPAATTDEPPERMALKEVMEMLESSPDTYEKAVEALRRVYARTRPVLP